MVGGEVTDNDKTQGGSLGMQKRAEGRIIGREERRLRGQGIWWEIHVDVEIIHKCDRHRHRKERVNQ